MPNILAVGIATLDVINTVAAYPNEDDEVRTLSQRRVRGGNSANTLVCLSQLGHACSWIGTLGDDASSREIAADFARHEVDISHHQLCTGGAAPTSYISLSADTASRTIVHHRDLPELSAQALAAIDLSQFDWVHFEGRNVDQLALMLEQVKLVGVPVSLEVEKPREGIEEHFDLPGLLMFSRQYARHAGFDDAEAFLSQPQWQGKCVTCAWGESGAWLKGINGQIIHSPAWSPEKLIDTVGAGDVFNAAVIHGAVNRHADGSLLADACHLAGYKCGQEGFGGLSAVLE